MTKVAPDGKSKKKTVAYNMNTIMNAVGAKSYVRSFERFNMSNGISITESDREFLVKIELPIETEILFKVMDIYNPLVYLDAYYNKKELRECVICGKHFMKCGNKKTCSDRCSKKYHAICVKENNEKNKTAAQKEKFNTK